MSAILSAVIKGLASRGLPLDPTIASQYPLTPAVPSLSDNSGV